MDYTRRTEDPHAVSRLTLFLGRRDGLWWPPARCIPLRDRRGIRMLTWKGYQQWLHEVGKQRTRASHTTLGDE